MIEQVGLLLAAAATLALAWIFLLFPLVVAAWGSVRRWKPRKKSVAPKVSFLIAAYNEEEHIEKKLRNTLLLDYPRRRLEIIVASDGSSDRTNEIVRSYANRGVRLLELPRGGKIAALNEAVKQTSNRILVFSDANTMYARSALRRLVRSFADDRVGGVSGNQAHRPDGSEDSTGAGESLYWRYDKWLKAREASTGNIVSADGAIYAIRRELWREPANSAVNDDFVISTSVIAQGKHLVFEPTAMAYEPPSSRAGEEFARKIRILSRGWWSVLAMRGLLNPFRYGFYSCILFTHKVMRRLTPLFLGTAVAGGLAATHGTPYFLPAAGACGAFLLAAGLGGLLRKSLAGRAKLLALPFFFCLANAAALLGLWAVVRGKKQATWQPRGQRVIDGMAVRRRRRKRAAAFRRAALFAGIVLGAGALAYAQFQLGSLLLPIVGVLALGAVAGLFFFPQLGTLLFIALAFANVPVLAGHALGNALVVGGLASGLVALPAFVQIYVLRRGWVLDRPMLLMMVFLATLCLSSLFAKDHAIALNWIMTFLMEGLLLYVLLVNALRRPAILRGAIWTIVVVGTILTTLGAYQEITQNYANDFGGLAQRKLTRWDESENGDVSSRSRDKVSSEDRIGGPVDDPNYFGQLLVMALPMAFLLAYSEKRLLARLAAIAFTVALLGGVMLTYSRGAAVVLALLILTVTALGYLRWAHLALATVVVLGLTAIVAPAYFVRVQSITRVAVAKSDADDLQSGDAAIRGRLTEMFAAAHVFLDHPIVGVGPGQYVPFYSLDYMTKPGVAFKQIDKERPAHTLYVELAAETGVFGLAAFLLIAFVVLARLWRLRLALLETNPDAAHLVTGIALALLAYLGTSFLLSFAFQRYYWMLVALAGAAVQVVGAPHAARVPGPAPVPARPQSLEPRSAIS
ncbi:glycosyltransferase [bacterium]|nr:glycosyltransferase [bacterium]